MGEGQRGWEAGSIWMKIGEVQWSGVVSSFMSWVGEYVRSGYVGKVWVGLSLMTLGSECIRLLR